MLWLGGTRSPALWSLEPNLCTKAFNVAMCLGPQTAVAELVIQRMCFRGYIDLESCTYGGGQE